MRFRNQAFQARGPVQAFVVEDGDLPVEAEVNVALHRVRAATDSLLEGGNRVFRVGRGRPSVADNACTSPGLGNEGEGGNAHDLLWVSPATFGTESLR